MLHRFSLFSVLEYYNAVCLLQIKGPSNNRSVYVHHRADSHRSSYPLHGTTVELWATEQLQPPTPPLSPPTEPSGCGIASVTDTINLIAKEI